MDINDLENSIKAAREEMYSLTYTNDMVRIEMSVPLALINSDRKAVIKDWEGIAADIVDSLSRAGYE